MLKDKINKIFENNKKFFTKEQVEEVAKKLGYVGDIDEFARGMEIELEHGTRSPETDITDDDPVMTAKITLAHLNEIPDYNTRLLAMEVEAKKGK